MIDPLEAARKAAAKPGRQVVVGGAQPARGNEVRKFTPARQKDYLDALARGVRRHEAAKLVGVSFKTVGQTRRWDPGFAEAEELAEGEAAGQIEDAVWELGRAGHFEAAKFWLMNRAPDRWKDPRTIKVDVAGQIDHAHGAAGQLDRIRALEATLKQRALMAGQTDDPGFAEEIVERAALKAAGDVIEAEILEDDPGFAED